MKNLTKNELNAAIEKNPDVAENYYKMGVLVYADKSEPNFLHYGQEWIEKAIAIDPYKGKYHFELGMIYSEQHWHWASQAKTCFERCIHLKYKVKESAKEIGKTEAKIKEGNNSRVAEYLKKIEDNPKDMEGYTYLISHYTYTDKNEAKAMEWLNIANEIDPNDSMVLHWMSKVYAKHGDVDLAASIITKEYEKDMDDPDMASEYYGEMCYMYEDAMDYENALIWKLKQIEVMEEPHCYHYYTGLGWLYNRLGRVEEAKETYQTCLEKLPDDDTTETCYTFLIGYYGEAGDLEKTKFYLDEGLRKYPEEANLHYQKGVILHQAGEIVEAIKSYKACLIFDPENLRALNNLGSIAQQFKQSEKALEHMLKALEQDPDEILTHENLIKIYLDLGNFERANYHTQRILELKKKL